MDLGLRQKRALVTTASRGLGLATARALGEEGAYVAMAGRDIATLEREAEAIRASRAGDVLPLKMDLEDPDSIAKGVDEVLARWGGIDILVANTPGTEAGPFVSIDREGWKQAIDTTIIPVVELMRRVIPSMKAAGGGRILCITTIGVKTAQPSMVLSNATRLAITGIAKTASVEHAQDNILVNTICPGPIDTDRMVSLIDATEKEKGVSRDEAQAIWLDEVPLGRMGSSKDFGKLAAVLVSDVASYVTGTAVAVDGGKARAY
jgi:3-oxoacyl-[acyl-carrier protein] reductase